MRIKFPLSMIVFACLMILALIVTACGGAAAPEIHSDQTSGEMPAAAAPKPDPVQLTWWLGGEQPADEARVEAALNAFPQLEALGVQVDLVFSDWSAYPSLLKEAVRLNMPCDLAYTSEWANGYHRLAAEGVLMPLDELVNNYAPDIFMQIPREAWDLTRINGLIYAVPHLTAWSEAQGVMADKTLLEKYQIKFNQAGTMPALDEALQKVFQGEPQLAGKLLGEVTGVGDPRSWGYEPAQLPGVLRTNAAARTVMNWFATPEYRQAVETLVRWRQAGYLPNQPLKPGNLLEARKIGEYPFHLAVFRKDLQAKADLQEGHPHAGMAFQPLLLSGVTNNLTGVCANSQNPSLALAFLNLVYTDEGVYNLLAKGIEGVHWGWVDAEQRLITRPDIMEVKKYSLNRDWMFGNQFLAYSENPQEVGTWQQIAQQNNSASVPLDGAFVFDSAPVQAEMSAVESIIARFDPGLRWGVVNPNDSNLGIEAFNRELQAAGLEKVLQEMQRQLDAYLSMNF